MLTNGKKASNGKVATPNGADPEASAATREPAGGRRGARVDGLSDRGALADGDPADCPTPGHSTPHSPNVKWQRSALGRRERWEALGHAGATIWFTGLPAAGKSTIAGAVEERLVGNGRPAFLLDGDNLRHGLNGDLGFGEEARTENVRRTAHVARLLAESGTIALVSLVSPYAHDREEAAALHHAADLPFVEVFVDAPLALCEQRDPKGLYARARAGELAGLTGIDAPYEVPVNPDLTLRSGAESVEDAVERVCLALDAACASALAVSNPRSPLQGTTAEPSGPEERAPIPTSHSATLAQVRGYYPP